jgi:hypothetical protein
MFAGFFAQSFAICCARSRSILCSVELLFLIAELTDDSSIDAVMNAEEFSDRGAAIEILTL